MCITAFIDLMLSNLEAISVPPAGYGSARIADASACHTQYQQ